MNQCTSIVRGSDRLAVVQVEDHTQMTPSEISQIVGKIDGFPTYKAGGLGVALIFHTHTRNVILGEAKANPALKELITKDGKQYPLQFNSTTGGRLVNPELSLREAAVNNVKNKMFLNTVIPQKGYEAEKILKKLCLVIENNEGWEKQVCIHTDKWLEAQEEKTMCFMTTIKHLSCTDEDLNKISSALQTIMNIKKEENVNPKDLSQFMLVELETIIQNSLETYMDKEAEKARKAYDKFEDKIEVIFNDLAVAALAQNGAFKAKEFAKLTI